MVQFTSPLTIAAPGEEYWNSANDHHHVLLDAMPVGAFPGAAFHVIDDPACVLDIHLPAGAVWDGINDTNLRVQPLRLGVGLNRGVEVVRLSQNRFNMKTLLSTVTPEPRPEPAENILLIGQSMMTGLASQPGNLLKRNPGVGLLNCAVGGSSLFQTVETPSNYWLELDHTPGPLANDALNEIDMRPIKAIVLALAHSMRNELESGELTSLQIREGLLALMTLFGWPTVPVVIEMPGLIPPGYSAGFQAIREVYQSIRDNEANVRAFEMLEHFPEPQDGTHYGVRKTALQAERAGMLIANPLLIPPHVVSVDTEVDGYTLHFSEPVTQADFGVPTVWAANNLSARLTVSGPFAWPDGAGMDIVALPYEGTRNFSLGGFTCDAS